MQDLAAAPLVRPVTTPKERDAELAIRRTVFVEEQGVAPEADLDQHEASSARHALAFVDGHAVGALRWRWYEPGVAKIERVAVLSAYRRRGIGRALVAWASIAASAFSRMASRSSRRACSM